MLIGLASQSPRRQALLRQIGVAFEVIDVTVDERLLRSEPAADYVARLARAKAAAGAAQPCYRQWTVLGADTAVVIDNRILGKPRDQQEAQAYLRLLSGTTHQVYSAVAVIGPSYVGALVSRSHVRFRDISPNELVTYSDSEEPLDKAGGYAIQGMAAMFVEHLEGSYSGVMGLPIYETAQLLGKAGIPLLPCSGI